MNAIKLSWSADGDRIYGLCVLTNSTDHEGEDTQREIALATLMLGKMWIHLNLYARKDGVSRVPRAWDLNYEPGYGWSHAFSERQIEDIPAFIEGLRRHG